MKVFAIILATAAFVAAQKDAKGAKGTTPAKGKTTGAGSSLSIPTVPSCATSCMGTVVSGLFADTQGCGINDLKCFCKTTPVQKMLKECVPAKCTAKTDAQAVYDVANKQCDGAPGYTKLTAK